MIFLGGVGKGDLLLENKIEKKNILTFYFKRMNDQTIYNMMIRVVEIITTESENYKNMELEKFGLENTLGNNIKLKEEMYNYFFSFVTKYSSVINNLKDTEDGVNNIGLLWFQFCENNQIVERLEDIRRNNRKMSV